MFIYFYLKSNGQLSWLTSLSLSSSWSNIAKLSFAFAQTNRAQLGGGEDRIRTCESLRFTYFPSMRHQPLGHLSIPKIYPNPNFLSIIKKAPPFDRLMACGRAF